MARSVEESSSEDIVIVFPVFNDWKVAVMLLDGIDEVLVNHGLRASVLAADDGSPISFETALVGVRQYAAIQKVEVLELGRNLGHQRAIAVSLSYIEEHVPCHGIIVMDADGEDDPKYIPELVERFKREQGTKVIFSRRTKRSEGFLFVLFYRLFRQIYRVFTGSQIRVGNYCMIPCHMLPRIVLLSEIWNHFSAGILSARIPYVEIPTERGKRLAGQSQMNFVSLVRHGLSAISVYADTLGIRALLATSAVMVISLLAILSVVSIRLWTDLAIPGWASVLTLLFFVVFMQAMTVSLFFIFLVLSGRNAMHFLPKRDYHHFVRKVHEVFSKV